MVSNLGHRSQDVLNGCWSYQADKLLTITQKNQRGPQRHPERSPQWPTTAIFNFQMLPLRERGQGFGHQRLGSTAMTTPSGAELQEGQAWQGVNAGAFGRFGSTQIRSWHEAAVERL